MNKFTHLSGFVESLFDDQETTRKATEIIKGMIQAHSPRLSDISREMRRSKRLFVTWKDSSAWQNWWTNTVTRWKRCWRCFWSLIPFASGWEKPCVLQYFQSILANVPAIQAFSSFLSSNLAFLPLNFQPFAYKLVLLSALLSPMSELLSQLEHNYLEPQIVLCYYYLKHR